MANWYVSSVGWTAVTAWAASTAYTVGQYRRQLATPTVGNERVFRCTTAGTSGATEPAWNLTNNATTNDGTAVWTQVAGQESHQSAGNWTAPMARIANAVTFAAANDTIFVSSDHAETQASALTIGSGSSWRNIVCVSRTGASLPPTSTDLATTATASTTGANSITLQGFYGRGITFSAGSAANTASITFSSSGPGVILEACGLVLNNSSASSIIQTDSTFRGMTTLDNVTLTFGSTSQSIGAPTTGMLIWRNTSSAVAGSIPTNLFSALSGNRNSRSVVVQGVDLSAVSTSIVNGTGYCGTMVLSDCRLHASVTMPTGTALDDISYIRFHNCDDSTNNRNYRFFERYGWGSVQSEATIYRTGGASDGVTPISHRHYVDGATIYARHLVGNWIGKRYNTTGASKTLTVEMLAFSSAIPTNGQVWIETDALTSSSHPLAATLRSGAADILASATNLTASTEVWGAGVSARGNSTVYAAGAFVKVASNPGRVFVCTSGGTSSGSEPAGFASAVDGGTITDGSVSWRAGWRVKVSQSFTPAKAGIVRTRVHVNIPATALAAESTVYVDPKLTIA